MQESAKEDSLTQKAFRVRYTVDRQPINYKYSVVEERHVHGSDFDNRKEFMISAAKVKELLGFIPSTDDTGLCIMWIIMPRVFIKEYRSPLEYWFELHASKIELFRFSSLRYFVPTNTSIQYQADYIHGRYRGQG